MNNILIIFKLPFLAIISIFAIANLLSCKGDDDLRVITVDLQFANKNTQSIKFDLQSSNSLEDPINVILQPDSISSLFSFQNIEILADNTIDNCCQDFLEDVYVQRTSEGAYKKITLNDTLCVAHEAEKSVLIKNYQAIKLSDKHYKFTYSFEENDLVGATPCK